MTGPDLTTSAFDGFLDRLYRGEEVDAETFLASNPGLSDDERVQVRRLGIRPVAAGSRAPGTKADADAERPPIGRVGGYRLGARIGAGAMGAVFLAEDVTLGRQVAVKILGSDLLGGADRGERFLREVRAIARLRHPNIVAIHSAGEQDGVRYLAMEFVPGSSLQEVIAESAARGTRVAASDVVAWGLDIARALQAAHDAGIIHRDVKPSNIRIAPDGHAVLLDFGLARDAGSATLTESGAFHGSPQYASPEQVGSGSAIDARTDLYSLAATLYEALTGVAPFRGETREQLFHGILTRDPVPPRRLDPSIPRDLETVILASLEKDATRRHATAAAFAADLEAVREGRPVSVRPPSALGRLARWARRQPAKAALALALIIAVPLLAVLAGFIAANLKRIKMAEEKERADHLQGLLVDAFLEYGEGDSAAGQAIFEQALAEDPESDEARAGFALCRISLNDPASALVFLEGPAKNALGRRWSEQIRAEALAQLGRRAEAEALAPILEPPASSIDYFVIGAIGLTHVHAGHAERAAAAFRALRQAAQCEKTPTPLYRYELGHAAWHAARHEEAREIAKAIVQLWPESPDRWFAVGRTLSDADPKASIDALQRAASPPPRSMEARDFIAARLAAARRGESLLARALALARETLALDPSRARSHLSLGYVLFESHDLDSAVREFREARRLDPGLQLAHRRLAETLAAMNDMEGALAPARDAVRLGSMDARSWNVLGLALFATGDVDEAVRSLEKAVAIDPENAEALWNLGKALIKQGEFVRGLERLKAGDARGLKDSRLAASKKWIAQAERLVALEKRLEEVRRGEGEPPNPEQRAKLAHEICSPKRLFAEAVTLYAEAFAADPTLTSQRTPNYLLRASGTAISAGMGKGLDAPDDAKRRAELRERARSWFEEQLRSDEDLVRANASMSGSVAMNLKPLETDPLFADVRPPARPEGLSDSEVDAWRLLWKRRDALLAGAETRSADESRPVR